MKRLFFYLIVMLFISLSACTSTPPQPSIDVVPPAPALTSTMQEQVVAMATATTLPAATELPSAILAAATQQAAQPSATAEGTQPQAQVPPLKSGGWQRVGKGLPFTFELPEGWITPDGFLDAANFWIPAGVPLEESHQWFAVNEMDLTGEQEPQTWPQNSAVQSRTPIEVNGVSYSKVQVKVFNGEGGTVNAYETHVVIPVSSSNKAYGLYVTAPTEEGRAALEEILVHAVQTLAFNQ